LSRSRWWAARVVAEAAGVQRAARPGAGRHGKHTPGTDLGVETTEVLGQRKLLKWAVPGTAHFLTFWGFTILLLTIIESYGALFDRTFSLPWVRHWAFVGFLEDLVAVGVLAGIITFTVIRLRHDPHGEGRASRFYGSHTGAARLCWG
jgi:hypothetical protein